MSGTNNSRGRPPNGTRPTGNRRIRCGGVGVGRMGRQHARAYAGEEGCGLVGVVDANGAPRSEIADRHECRAFETVDQLLSAGVDAVSVAVPTVYHKPAAVPLLEAGVACLIEKPLAGNVEEAWAIKEVAERTKSILMVGHI